MSIFEQVGDQLNAIFSEWIKIEDPKTKWTIEDFPYDTGVNENLTNPHCFRCVTVNRCWFKNEENKKPKEFDYSNYTFSQISSSIRGIYHPNCHCKQKPINVPKLKDIELIIPEGKAEWLFRNKINWRLSMGYKENEKELILKNIYQASKEAYCRGQYFIKQHDKYGVKITLNITLPGVNEKSLKSYSLVSSYMIFPNGKLKNNTMIGGTQK